MSSFRKKIKKWIKAFFRKDKISHIEQSKAPSHKKRIETREEINAIKVRFVEDVPEEIVADTVYVVGSNGFFWMLGLNCPCQCGNFIQLNLLPDANPRWKFRIIKGYITISPSVWRTVGCKSHFFVRKGRIDWVRKYNETKIKRKK